MKQVTTTILLTILLSMVGTKALAYDIEVKNDDGVTIYYNYINDGKELEVTYRNEDYQDFCNGFTLGSHGEYFINRNSHKNIQYPYDEYCGHFCLGIIYTRSKLNEYDETRIYSMEDIEDIPAVIKDFVFFAEEKWKIASDKGGSGNTANIGSIQKIDDILTGNGVFAKAGEELFDDYWANFGKIELLVNGKRKKLSSFEEYLEYRGLPKELNNPKAVKRKSK